MELLIIKLKDILRVIIEEMRTNFLVVICNKNSMKNQSVKTRFYIISDVEIRRYGNQTELETRVVHTDNAGY